MKTLTLPFAAAAMLLPALCQADTSSDVLQKLKQADVALLDGTFRSTSRFYDIGSGSTLFQQRESLTKREQFEFSEKDTDATGRMTLQRKTSFDGRDSVCWLGDPSSSKASVEIERGKGYAVSPLYGLLMIQPGYCLIQGRGLSAMKIHKLERDPASSFWICQAQAPDKSSIKAWLDPHARYLARRIERSDKGGLLSHIETQGQQAGGLLPLRSVVSTPGFGGSKPSVYTFSNCQFPSSKPFSFRGVLMAPGLIIDNRLGSSVSIQKQTHAPLSLDSLLRTTEQETQKHLENNRTENAALSRQTWMNRGLMTLPLLLAGAILFWRPQKRKEARSV